MPATGDGSVAVAVQGQRPSLKALVLLLACAVNFGSAYCYQNPAALKNQLQEHFVRVDMDKNEFELLFVSPQRWRADCSRSLLY